MTPEDLIFGYLLLEYHLDIAAEAQWLAPISEALTNATRKFQRLPPM